MTLNFRKVKKSPQKLLMNYQMERVKNNVHKQSFGILYQIKS